MEQGQLVTEDTRRVLKVKNLYSVEKFIEDIKEQFKLFGKETFKSEGIDIENRTSSGKKAYLPSCRIKLWKRHLVMCLSYLSFARNKKGFKEYMNKRFGNNWFIKKGNTREIRILLIKNILDEEVSNINNKWLCKASIWSDEFLIEKVPERDIYHRHPYEKDDNLGDGLFVEVKNNETST